VTKHPLLAPIKGTLLALWLGTWRPDSAPEGVVIARYYPVAGWIVGGLGAAIVVVATWRIPQAVAVLLALAAGMVVTGGRDEAGLASFCDDATPDTSASRQRLGAAGALALMMSVLIRFATLSYLPRPWLAAALVAGVPATRLSALLVCGALFRPSLTRSRTVTWLGSVAATVLGYLPLAYFAVLSPKAPVLGAPLVIAAGFALAASALAAWAWRRDGGNDAALTLGAPQQVAEAAFLVSLLLAVT